MVAIAAGYEHSMALKNDGTVVVWGDNTYGARTVPSGLTGVVAIAAGAYHSVALKQDGTVSAWGANSNGESAVPEDLNNVIALSASAGRSVALIAPAAPVLYIVSPRVTRAAAVGLHTIGEPINYRIAAIGNPTSYAAVGLPVGVSLNTTTGIISGVPTTPGDYSVTVTARNKFWSGSQVIQIHVTGSPGVYDNLPTSAVLLQNSVSFTFTAARVSSWSSMDLPAGLSLNSSNGTLSGRPTQYGTFAATITAHNEFGSTSLNWTGEVQTIVSSYDQSAVPTGIGLVIAVVAGAGHNVALRSNGSVVAWGYNNLGQATVPAGLNGVISIAASHYHTLALKNNGTVVAWGDNCYGQTTVPVGLNGVVAISGGRDFSLALKNDGTVVGWGRVTVPTGLNGVTSISSNDDRCLALKGNGTLVAWGGYSLEELEVIAGVSGVDSISVGIDHGMALKSDGTVVAWGYGSYGESAVPVGLSGVAAITAGNQYSAALKSDGTVVEWGNPSQTRLPAGLRSVTAITSGLGHVLVLLSSNQLTSSPQRFARLGAPFSHLLSFDSILGSPQIWGYRPA